MTEAYLHYIWKHQLFDKTQLQTTAGDSVEIIHRGQHNSNAGPDFIEGKVKIGSTLWAGHIEIHIAGSDWLKHNHQHDKAYNNVVLHVVYENDIPAERENKIAIPTLELKGLFDEMGYWRYEQFVGQKRNLACENQLQNVDNLHIAQMLDRTLVERLQEKSKYVAEVFKSAKNDWNETFYRMLFYSFGLKVNAEAMLALAERVPLQIVRKHTGNLFQIEALLQGTAGLISGEEKYAQELQKEFYFLQKKYSIISLEKHQFKLARLRPVAFPSVRIAQLAAILSASPDLFRTAMNVETPKKFIRKLQQKLPQFWETHYRFGKIAAPKNKTVAISLAHQVLINAVLPVLFQYSRMVGDEKAGAKVFDWLRNIPAENNKVVKAFKIAGFKIENAADSQGCIQLHNYYCEQRKCLSCAIGVKLLKQWIRWLKKLNSILKRAATKCVRV